MIIGVIGANAVSQLYRSFTGQGSDASGPTRTAPAPTDTTAAARSTPAPSLADQAKTLAGDLNAFLLSLQANTGTSPAPTPSPGSPSSPTANSVPPSPLQIELQRLNEAARNEDGGLRPHHHHPHAGPGGSAIGTNPADDTSTSGSTVLAQFARALSAYASNFGTTAPTTQLSA